MNLYKALRTSQDYIAKELGEEIAYDPVVCSNLHMCYNNTCPGAKNEGWDLFLAHVCWPEDNEFPDHLYLVPSSQVPGYNRLMQRLEEVYK